MIIAAAADPVSSITQESITLVTIGVIMTAGIAFYSRVIRPTIDAAAANAREWATSAAALKDVAQALRAASEAQAMTSASLARSTEDVRVMMVSIVQKQQEVK